MAAQLREQRPRGRRQHRTDRHAGLAQHGGDPHIASREQMKCFVRRIEAAGAVIPRSERDRLAGGVPFVAGRDGSDGAPTCVKRAPSKSKPMAPRGAAMAPAVSANHTKRAAGSMKRRINQAEASCWRCCTRSSPARRKLLTRRGVLIEEQGQTTMADNDSDNDSDSDQARALKAIAGCRMYLPHSLCPACRPEGV